LSFLDRLNKKVILIRNSNDKFCSPKIKQAVSKMPDVRFYELPGEHDDYYTNPRPYIALIPKDL